MIFFETNPEVTIDPATPSQNLDAPNQGASSTASSHCAFEKWAIKDKVLKAEILFTIHNVVNHHSFNSKKHTSALLEIMCSDSLIAKQFSCGPSKMSYMAAFGIAPYFSDLLVKELSKVPFYSISFNESYNTVAKKEQFDVLVRYYDVQRSQTIDRYVCSQFLGHTKAENLLENILDATSQLELEKIINLGMDSPNVNHRLLKLFLAERKRKCQYLFQQ